MTEPGDRVLTFDRNNREVKAILECKIHDFRKYQAAQSRVADEDHDHNDE